MTKKRVEHFVNQAHLTKLKSELREQCIKFRDCDTTIIVPQFNEVFSLEEIARNKVSPGMAAYKALKKSDIAKWTPYYWRQDEIELLDLRAPRYLKSDWQNYGKPTLLYYVDLWHSYQQIYEYSYWRIDDFPNGERSHPIGKQFEHLADWREARNSIVGIARSTKDKWVEGPQVSYVKKINPFLSPTLWAEIIGVLNHVAWRAYDKGAIHINTDGYIFDDLTNCEWFLDFLFDHDMTYKYWVDPVGVLRGYNNYTIGKKTVGEWQESPTVKPIMHLESEDYCAKIFYLWYKQKQAKLI